MDKMGVGHNHHSMNHVASHLVVLGMEPVRTDKNVLLHNLIANHTACITGTNVSNAVSSSPALQPAQVRRNQLLLIQNHLITFWQAL